MPTRSRRLALVPLVLLAGAALPACSTGSDAPASPTTSTASSSATVTPDRARAVLLAEGPAGDGALPGGAFEFGSPVDNAEMRMRGRIASASWDVYWHLDSGDRGAWGVGIDVFGSATRATRTVRDEAAFWCPRERRAIGGLAHDPGDLLLAFSCRRAGGEGFYATLDATDEAVGVNLTVARPTRAAAEESLRAVWEPLHVATERIAGELGGPAGTAAAD